MPAPKASRAGASLRRAKGGDTGTLHAILETKPKVQAGRNRWGGARNRRDRVTAALTLAQARGVVDAVAYAERIGLRMTRLVTVHWGAMHVSDADAARATGKLLKHVREALAEMGLPFACVWTRENDEGDASKGAHVHILVHVPAAAGKGFMRRWRRWVRLAAGGRFNRRRGRIEGKLYVDGAIDTRPIGRRLHVSEAEHRLNLAVAVCYLIKGGELATVETMLEHPLLRDYPVQALYRRGQIQHNAGGLVTGKRAGCSENIGPKARRSEQ